MKRINFLAKLKKEGKLEIVEPSEEIKDSYIKKSESNIISAKILLENNRLEESVSLSYYSMYHMATALFYKTGIKCGNHAALIVLLKKIFDFISRLDSSKIKEYREKFVYLTVKND